VNRELLGRAIGINLALLDGLSAAYLPDAVDSAAAEAMVRAANEVRPADPPFAILVQVGEENNEDARCLRLQPASAIRYRQDDRLAIVVGRHPDLASFVQAFREVLSQSYPSRAVGQVGLPAIAATVIREVLAEARVEVEREWGEEKAIDRLTACMEQLRDAHEQLRQGPRGWNAYWFEHVTIGLDNLVTALCDAARSNPALSLEKFFERFTFAAFALPVPDDGVQLRGGRPRTGRAIVDALLASWSDSESISITVKQLAHHPETAPRDVHPLSEIDWMTYNRTVAAVDNQLLSFAKFVSAAPRGIDLVAELTESQFFDPYRRLNESRNLLVVGSDGEDLSIDASSESGPFVLSTELINPVSTSSQIVRIRIPLTASPHAEQVEKSGVRVACGSKQVTWSGALELVDGILWSVGRFTRSIISEQYSRPLVTTSVTVRIQAGDSLAGVVDPAASGVVDLLPHAGAGLIFMKVNARGVIGLPTYVGAESVEPTHLSEGRSYPGTFDDATSNYQILIWSDNADDAGRLDSTLLKRVNSRPGLWAIRLVPHGLDEFSISGTSFELRTPEPKAACHSPIVAAIDNQLVSADRPSVGTERSIRGVLEEFFADHIGDQALEDSLGHVVLPADIDLPTADLSLHDSSLMMTSDMHRQWSALTGFKVPQALLHSEAAEIFRMSVRELGLAEALSPNSADAGKSEWPSRTSWRHLWERDRNALDAYLTAYTELVRVAREIGDPSGVFWATYPFTASIWDVRVDGKCVAVLLSPLHPLRLAWLASVESTLWDAPEAKYLAGTLEGWNFPIFGPRETSNGRMLAIPMDSGEGQVFLGWTMLVGASIDGELPLTAPTRVGNLPAPGSAASGLNATAAASALRTYRRMNPHVSTLTVDLAASSPTTRLDEVDAAVLSALAEWNSSGISQLAGGARIWDSMNRGGEAPREAVTKLARNASGAPLAWVRYAHDPFRSRRSNIRMLQDSGIRIEIGNSPRPNLGVMGLAPLRRFEAYEVPTNESTTSESRPALAASGAWIAFGDALSALESAWNHPRISSKLLNAALIDDRADWTVSGEALMSPNAMAALIHADGSGAQMLWEWRPPFLEPTAGVPVLERRPFVSIARVPASFRDQVRVMLSKAHDAEASVEHVNHLLGTLGARGVGLSSLISMGGTHAAGALGFYLVFALMEKISSGDSADTFVLPIDACDTFIKALAGTSSDTAATRRADLLIVRLTDDSITLTPIEIKFYDFLASEPDGVLPKPSDSDFTEPLQQLEFTYELLQKLQSRWSEVSSTGSAASKLLWLNGLTSLVEAGAKLRPKEADPSGHLVERMTALVQGELPVKLGRPIVTYFKYKAESASGLQFDARIAQSSDSHREIGDFGSLASNVAVAFDQANTADSDLVVAWREIVEWSAQNANSLQVAVEVGEGLSSREPEQIADSGGNADTDFNTVAEPGDNGESAMVDLTSHDDLVSDELVVESERSGLALALAPTESAELEDFAMGVRFPVGRVLNSVGNAYAEYWPSNTELNQMNIGVVGDLGTGKTQLLKSLIFNLRVGAARAQTNPLSVLIFDYKRDFQDAEFLESVGGEVLRPSRIPLNIFDLPNGYTPLGAFQKAKSFCDVIGKIYSGVGPVQRDRLVTVVTDIFKAQNGRPPTLAQVLDSYRDGIKADSVVGILNTFVLGEVFSDEPSELKSFDSLIHNKVLVLAVSDMGADQDGKNALVALFLNMYYEYMLQSQKWPYAGTSPQLRRLNSYLLVDEAVNIMRYDFPALMDLMLQGREFGFGTILASQYLSHFRTSASNYGEPLLTWFIHKVPSVTPKELEQLGITGLPAAAASRISEQSVHEALYDSFGYEGTFIRGTPFYELARQADQVDERAGGN
jgi:DNA phosphorothioation-dependent restriction protein DptH